jgi:cytochrome c oxidase assembly factor CtaG
VPLAGYQFDLESVFQLIALGAAALTYLAYRHRAETLARHGRPLEPWREWSFVAGLLVGLAAVSPPVDSWSHKLFAAHMAQHLLIGDISGLLLVLGLPGPMLQPVLSVRVIDRLRFLANPIPAIALWAVNFYVWHIPFMYEAAYDNDFVHALQHLTFLVFGAVMWMPLFGPLPKPAWFTNLGKLGYIIAVRLLGTLLGNVFAWSGTVFYGFYKTGEAHQGVGALTDQSVAGAVMMIEQSILTICLFGWLFMRAAAEGEEKQELLEWAAARGFELSDKRAARAVAAGRADELRERLAREVRPREASSAPARGAAASAGSGPRGS